MQSIEGLETTFTVAIPLGRSHLPQERFGAARTLTSTTSGAMPFLEEALSWVPDSESEVRPAGQNGGTPSLLSTNAIAIRAEPNNMGMGANAGELELSRPRILWADDNADMRSYVTPLLSPRLKRSSGPRSGFPPNVTRSSCSSVARSKHRLLS